MLDTQLPSRTHLSIFSMCSHPTQPCSLFLSLSRHSPPSQLSRCPPRGAAAPEGAHEAVRKKKNLMVAATLCRGQFRPTTEPEPSSSPPPDDHRRKPIPFLTSRLPPSLDRPNHSPPSPPLPPLLPPSTFSDWCGLCNPRRPTNGGLGPSGRQMVG